MEGKESLDLYKFPKKKSLFPKKGVGFLRKGCRFPKKLRVFGALASLRYAHTNPVLYSLRNIRTGVCICRATKKKLDFLKKSYWGFLRNFPIKPQ